jgi:hypothetical protein
MDDMRPTHPFATWMAKEGLTFDEVAEWCRRLGRPTSKAYLKQIALGYYEPGYDFAKFIVDRLCNRAFTVDAIKADYPYRRAKRSRAA